MELWVQAARLQQSSIYAEAGMNCRVSGGLLPRPSQKQELKYRLECGCVIVAQPWPLAHQCPGHIFMAGNMQVPALSIFETSLRRGKFDKSRQLSNGGMLEFAHIYPMDAVYDTPEDVPEDVSPA